MGDWRTRLLRAACVGGVGLCVFIAIALPWLELPDSLDPLLNETAGVGYVNLLPDHLALAVSDAGAAGVRVLERGLSLGVFGLYLLWETRRVWTDPSCASIVRGTARTSLVYILIASTSVQAWYFALPVSLAVLLGLRSSLARVTIGYTLVALPTMYASYYLRDLVPTGAWVVYGMAPLLALVPFGRFVRGRRHAPVRVST